MNWKRVAQQTIKPSTEAEEVIFADGDTDDIVSVILHADRLAAPFTASFAPYLRGRNVEETTKNVWAFVKENIKYQRDKNGHERIKSPGKLWADKTGDCKSMSVFVASVLQNLGIPYKYRFAFYPNPGRPFDKDVNHVFVIALAGGREIPVDTVASRWNYEEPYEYAYDQEMQQAHNASINGIFSYDLSSWAPGIIGFILGWMTAKSAEQ